MSRQQNWWEGSSRCSPPARAGRVDRCLLGLYRQVQMVLILARHNLTQMTVADLFGISQPTVSRIWRRLLPLIEEVTCLHGVELAEAARGRTVLVDHTYVPTGNRAATGRTNYSPNRHCQCLSIQVASDTEGTLLAVSAPVARARHDAAAIRLTGWQEILEDASWVADTAYTTTTAITPIRKPAGRDLTEPQKQFNHQVSSIRVAVERCNAHLKDWKILATGYRGRLAELPLIIRIATKLELYRLGW
jgi:hypothetical protein